MDPARRMITELELRANLGAVQHKGSAQDQEEEPGMADRKVVAKQDGIFRTNAEPFEPPDNPLPTADPAIAPMRRPCMERGCQYRSRALVYGGWLLAVLDLFANVAIVHDWVQVSRAQAAAIVERDALRAELAVRQAPRPPAVVVPAPPPARPVPARPRPRPKSVSDVPPPVPESEKWWNR